MAGHLEAGLSQSCWRTTWGVGADCLSTRWIPSCMCKPLSICTVDFSPFPERRLPTPLRDVLSRPDGRHPQIRTALNIPLKVFRNLHVPPIKLLQCLISRTYWESRDRARYRSFKTPELDKCEKTNADGHRHFSDPDSNLRFPRRNIPCHSLAPYGSVTLRFSIFRATVVMIKNAMGVSGRTLKEEDIFERERSRHLLLAKSSL